MPGTRRVRGEGSIYPVIKKSKYGDSQYYVAKYKPANRTKAIYRYCKTETAAKRMLVQLKTEANKFNDENVKKMSVKEYILNWLNTIKAIELKPMSFDIKERVINDYVIPRIGDYQNANLEPRHIQKMIADMADEGFSYSTIRKVYDSVNACYKLGVIKREIEYNPCIGVSMPKNIKKRLSDIRFFVDDEIEKICNACIAKYGNGSPVYRLGHAVIVLMYTGLRKGELLALEWENIDFNEKKLTVKQNAVMVRNRAKDAETKFIHLVQDSGKTDSSCRIIPLNKKAIAALEEIKKINGDFKYVMATKSGKIMNPRNLSRMFETALERCNIEPTGVHACRHTFASMLFKAGVDVKTVSELLGHANVNITYNIYIHLIKEQKFAAVELLDEL